MTTKPMMTTNFKLFFENVKQLPLFFILKHKESGGVYGIESAYDNIRINNNIESVVDARLVLVANIIGVHRSFALFSKKKYSEIKVNNLLHSHLFLLGISPFAKDVKVPAKVLVFIRGETTQRLSYEEFLQMYELSVLDEQEFVSLFPSQKSKIKPKHSYSAQKYEYTIFRVFKLVVDYFGDYDNYLDEKTVFSAVSKFLSDQNVISARGDMRVVFHKLLTRWVSEELIEYYPNSRSLKLTDKGRAITLDQLSTSGTFDAALDIM